VWQEALQEGLSTLIEYLEPLHLVLAIFPAFLISGAVASLLEKESILRFFGPTANRWVSLSVASVAGAVLAVCSCSVLPMFASMYKIGAGIGPASSFLYSGPSINAAAIFISAAMLGMIGWTRSLSAVFLALAVGVCMDVFYGLKRRKGEVPSPSSVSAFPWRGLVVIASLVSIYFHPHPLYKAVMLGFAVVMGFILFSREKRSMWFKESWSLLRMIFPILVAGVFVASALRALVPEVVIVRLFGEGHFPSNILASVVGALLYFGTLAEVPITRSLLDMGMAPGAAVAFLLAGPALSLPNMIIINRIVGLKKGMSYIVLVVLFSALAGWIYQNVS